MNGKLEIKVGWVGGGGGQDNVEMQVGGKGIKMVWKFSWEGGEVKMVWKSTWEKDASQKVLLLGSILKDFCFFNSKVLEKCQDWPAGQIWMEGWCTTKLPAVYHEPWDACNRWNLIYGSDRQTDNFDTNSANCLCHTKILNIFLIKIRGSAFKLAWLIY